MTEAAPPAKHRQHNPRACRLTTRPRIRNGFLHFVAAKFRFAMWHGTPFAELRRLIDEQVPSTGTPRVRALRSDLIESISLVVYCLLSRLDLRSLRVGFHAGHRRKHDFVGLSRQTLASWTGLSEETVSRVMTLLRRAGLVHGPGRDGVNIIAQPCDLVGGAYVRHPAIRRFDPLFFQGLGVGTWLHRIRTGADQAPPSPADRAAVGPKSTRALVGGLAHTLALERPPDG